MVIFFLQAQRNKTKTYFVKKDATLQKQLNFILL